MDIVVSCYFSHIISTSQLGLLQGEYTIKLNSNATTFALTTPRCIPLPVIDEVKQKLRIKKQNDYSKWKSPPIGAQACIPKPIRKYTSV